MSNFRSVHIVPTYECNLSCSYCYASKYKQDYKTLSWKNYLKILDLLVENNVRRIIFIGGEPSIWPHIDAAIEAAKGMEIHTALISNAVKHTNALPHTVTVNGTNLADQKLRPLILGNLSWYKNRGVQSNLRFNLNAQDSPKKFRQYIEWGKHYGDSISFSPTVPYGLAKKIGAALHRFAKMAVSAKIPIKLNRAVPLCIFTPEQRLFLLKHATLYSICHPATREFTINPDLSILPCVDLNIPKKLSRDFRIVAKKYQVEVEALQKKPKWKKCRSCMFFGDVCQGGCLSIKCKSPYPV
ncbi:MAG: radical SAM protein [Patescibacteria group bacterium]